MMNPARLAAMLRFHLSELSSQNAHHLFEHLARHLARARLFSNILPATGPVSAGGDGGKDFETFRTYIAPNRDPGSTFAARTSGERVIAFACSLEKRIEAKIRKDMNAVRTAGGIDELVVFCEANVAVAKRHKLIAEAEDDGFDLQIVDGNAIAEWLTEPDLFWVAEEYLKVPAELFPAISRDQAYLQHKQEWTTRSVLPISTADFVAVKSGIRHATFDPDARPDLGFWLAKMEGFLGDPTPRGLARSATYEIAVGHLRGRNDLTSQTQRLLDYFSDVDDFPAIGDLTDATALLAYAFGALFHGHYRADDAILYDWRRRIEETLEMGLAVSKGPGQRAGYLNVLGMLEHTPRSPGEAPELSAAIQRWQAMLDHVDEARLFPLESFADYIVKMVALYGNDRGLEDLAGRVDDMLALRIGAAAAGKKAVERAMSLIERGELAEALRILHAAKAKWFSGENMGSVMRILLLMSEQYCRLGLAYAGKYHAMVAAFLAHYEPHQEVRHLEPEGLLALADAEDVAGNSLGFLQLLPLLLESHVRHEDRPLELERHPRLAQSLGQLAALLGFLKRGNPAARAVLDQTISSWPALVSTPLIGAAAAENGFWLKGSWEEAWTELEEMILDRPFGDLGQERCVRWHALGLDWSCRFANDYRTTPHAEQLVSELQLIGCAISGRDLGLAPCEIELQISVAETENGRLVINDPSPDNRSLRVTLPPGERGPDQAMEAMVAFGAAMRACSVLGDEDLMEVFDRGPLEALFVGRPYSELYREFVPEVIFNDAIRVAAPPLDPERPFDSRAGTRVAWFDGPGADFDEARAEEDVLRRYDWARRALQYTLGETMQDPGFVQRLAKLHEQGKTDWEILSILNNIAVAARGFSAESMAPENRELALRAMEFEEQPQDALPAETFSAEKIDIYSKVYIGAFTGSWGLRWPICATPEKMEIFLAARYGLRTVDVPHEMQINWEKLAQIMLTPA